MEIRKLTSYEELLESAKVIATAFMHPWIEKEAKEEARRQAEGQVQGAEAWGLFSKNGKMIASVSTQLHVLAFGGQKVLAGELHMVGSLPEGRGSGNVRSLVKTILEDYRDRGCTFSLLIPFSYSFYRKFGFEVASGYLEQRVPIDQLANIPCPYEVMQLQREDEISRLRSFADAFASSRNMAEIKGDEHWRWNGNGDYGEPNFMHAECPRYTYLLEDSDGKLHAFLRFLFTHEPSNPFVGELIVDELVYDSPQSLLGALGFLYGMRAKVSHISLNIPDDIDLGTILPECGKIERTKGGHVMARLLDVRRALSLMPHPLEEGQYALRVTDKFMPQNSGVYQVNFTSEDTQVIKTCDQTASCDLELTEETLVMLVIGIIGLDEALYRPYTCLHGNELLLRKVFRTRAVCLR